MDAVLAAVAALVVLVGYLAWLAVRIDRLAGRVEAAWSALDTQLVRRAAAAVALAARLGDEDLRRAAEDALAAPQAHRDAVENALSRALRRAHPAGVEVLDEPAVAATRTHGPTTVARVRLARQFYNDAVRDLRALRNRRILRLLHLGATRPLPGFFEIDDSAMPRVALPPAPAAAVDSEPADPAVHSPSKET